MWETDGRLATLDDGEQLLLTRPTTCLQAVRSSTSCRGVSCVRGPEHDILWRLLPSQFLSLSSPFCLFPRPSPNLPDSVKDDSISMGHATSTELWTKHVYPHVFCLVRLPLHPHSIRLHTPDCGALVHWSTTTQQLFLRDVPHSASPPLPSDFLSCAM